MLLLPLSAGAAAEPAAGKQVELKYTDPGDATLSCEYLLFLPTKYDEDRSKRWPVMLFLHGRGESFGPLRKGTRTITSRTRSGTSTIAGIAVAISALRRSWGNQAGN